MENLERMFNVGLYINDLSMHDSSRDLVLAGTQQQAELKMALAQVGDNATEIMLGSGKVCMYENDDEHCGVNLSTSDKV